MKHKDFTTAIEVDASPGVVFNAITHPENWWSGEVKGRATRLGDEFEYRYKDFHRSKQKVVEMDPGKKIVWLVTDSSINYAEDKSEWTGTKIIFEISEEEGKTRVLFTHMGLHPEIECFDSCSASWTSLIRLSLAGLITTGKGQNIVLA